MEQMIFNYNKLRGRIVEKCGTIRAFADAIGVSEVSISKYLNNKVEWGQRTIDEACRVLDIPREEIPIYFFVPDVQK